jgi:hypothetical protein
VPIRALTNNAGPLRATRLFGSSAVVAVALLAIATPAHALHCGPRVISRGDDVAKLLEFCGDPVNVESRRIERTPIDGNGRVYRGFTEEVIVEEWTYNFGPYQLMVKIRLDNGVVAEIKYLGYGY